MTPLTLKIIKITNNIKYEGWNICPWISDEQGTYRWNCNGAFSFHYVC